MRLLILFVIVFFSCVPSKHEKAFTAPALFDTEKTKKNKTLSGKGKFNTGKAPKGQTSRPSGFANGTKKRKPPEMKSSIGVSNPDKIQRKNAKKGRKRKAEIGLFPGGMRRKMKVSKK